MRVDRAGPRPPRCSAASTSTAPSRRRSSSARRWRPPAAIIYSINYGDLQWNIGFRLGIIAFTAAVLGGIGNIVGAGIGGFLIGLIYVFGGSLPGGEWSEALIFAILVLILTFRPVGPLRCRGDHAVREPSPRRCSAPRRRGTGHAAPGHRRVLDPLGRRSALPCSWAGCCPGSSNAYSAGVGFSPQDALVSPPTGHRHHPHLRPRGGDARSSCSRRLP